MLFLLALLSLTFAENQQGTPTLCEKYAAAKGLNQTALMTAIVGAVVGAELNSTDIAEYFDGSVPAGSTDFTTDTAAFNSLAAGLIAFFGHGLGCNDASFPAYTGPTMQIVHSDMPIGRDDFDLFNDIFIDTVLSLGVTSDDATSIRSYLDTFADQIVKPALICNKYATALNITEIKLMTVVVTTVVQKELGNADILPYFNGQQPAGSIDFTTDTAQYNRLANGLIAFFGGALGCAEAGFPAYTGPNMATVHGKMGIDVGDFTTFNNEFIAALQSLNVTSGDQVTIRGILDSFQSQIVNPLPQPAPEPLPEPAPGSSSNGFTFVPSLLLALCVMLFL